MFFYVFFYRAITLCENEGPRINFNLYGSTLIVFQQQRRQRTGFDNTIFKTNFKLRNSSFHQTMTLGKLRTSHKSQPLQQYLDSFPITEPIEADWLRQVRMRVQEFSSYQRFRLQRRIADLSCNKKCMFIICMYLNINTTLRIRYIEIFNIFLWYKELSIISTN